MADIAGIDCGLTYKERTSGICRTGTKGFVVGHTYIDKLSRNQLFLPASHFVCLGIDGPILPKNVIHDSPRPVESVFMRGAFQTRCKPGASHVRGTGQALRRAGCDAAMQFSAETFAQGTFPYPRVQTNQTIVEAFPNAFLGVLIDEQVIDEVAPSRGQKTDIFFSLCNNHGAFQQLEQYLVWQDAAFWAAFQTTSNHEDLAALVCAATAICAHLGKYVAVGDVSGGYFFLPPWCLWKPWAMAALDSARKKSGLHNIVRVWMDGSSYGPNDRLP